MWFVGLEFGAFTDLVGRVENAEDSSDVELDELDEIELFGLFHPTAAKIFGSFYHNHILKSMIRRAKMDIFVRSMSKVWVFLRVRGRSFGFSESVSEFDLSKNLLRFIQLFAGP